MITRYGASLSFLGEQPDAEAVSATARELADLGFESLWTSEAYGADCFTPLAWWGAHATTARLGTAVTQMAARAPAATAMAAMSLDQLSAGRVVLGLGVSGPQVVEGWYGAPFRTPLRWTREYIDIVRAVIARSAKVSYDGQVYQLPSRTGTGLGKPIRSSMRPYRTRIPIYLGAEGPRNIALAAEVADGWLATNYSPIADAWFAERLDEGFRARPGGRPEDFEVAASASVAVAPDVESAADRLRPRLALYIGGMGARARNFHLDAIARLGFADPCREIQERFLADDRDGAVAAVPTELIEAIALIGPPEKIAGDLRRWEDSVVDTFIARGSLADLRALSPLLRERTPPRMGDHDA
jgi:F420-dependent oxidoreductase-like protein